MKIVALKAKLKKNKELVPWILFVLSCFIILYLFFSKPVDKAQREIDSLVKSVSKLVILPEESPTVATVTNLEELKGQEFFKNAKVGDKVLIFVQAQKAVLYNPDSNRVVEIAPLNTEANSQVIKP